LSSSFSRAQYVWLCKLTLDEEKSKRAGLPGEKWFWICIFAHFAVAGTKHCKECNTFQKKGVINMIWLFLPVSDSPIIMIGPCGLLLLVVSHLFAISVSVLWVRLEKGKKPKLGCEISLLGELSALLELLLEVRPLNVDVKRSWKIKSKVLREVIWSIDRMPMEVGTNSFGDFEQFWNSKRENGSKNAD
jgi:hypothetical protein